MTDDLNTMREDIAFVRDLAEQGRNTPLLNGPIMVAAAIIFGAASVAHYLHAVGNLPFGPWTPLWIWVAAGATFAVALTLLIRRMETESGARSTTNKAVGAAWSGVGFGIFSIWAGLMAIGFTTGRWEIMAAMPIVVFAAYGVAWIVAGAMAEARWMTMTGVGCYIGAVLLGIFSSSPVGYLVFAALLVFGALLPGLALMRQAAAARRG